MFAPIKSFTLLIIAVFGSKNKEIFMELKNKNGIYLKVNGSLK